MKRTIYSIIALVTLSLSVVAQQPKSKVGPAATSLIGNVSASATSFTDSTVSDGATYFYWITAVGPACPLQPPPGLFCGESALSNIAPTTIPASGSHVVTLSWADSVSTGVVSQNIYRASVPAAPTGATATVQ